ncbi:NPCBM/NEW2 domain-containing protein [Longispora sp. NPDC051575]|uniref:NPCBM/NEW2 domain-containing protein n=1 Tax=Longispora sp. NPDC051575 TaxID=3154943 RepID=UPI0034263521
MRMKPLLAAAVGLVLASSILSPGTAVAADPGHLGAVTGFAADGATYTFSSGAAKVRVVFQKADVFRLWLAPDGEFTDPANTAPADPAAPKANLVVKTDYPVPATTWKETRDTYELRTASMRLVARKSALTFTLYGADNKKIWAETAPLSWTSGSATQSLSRGDKEQFFGGGMQNGRFSHRDQTIAISTDYNWEDGGNPNAVPYYMSTAGYGVFRNTFAPGSYAFTAPVATTHDERRFDAYFFVGDLKQSLDRYTELTGRPFMPPVYGLEYGDADCYNRSNPGYKGTRDPDKLRTPDAVKVAQGFVDHDMPRGWMLVNDGYGCEYVDLDQVGTALRDRKIDMGLWTERALTNQPYEVGTAGVRVRKLDVAWVGEGYRQALSGCEDAHDGIERHSDARGFVWMVEGWTGSQRCAVTWTGDHAGSLDAIRWQIPAIHGSGLSGQAYAAGDIDGIFGGSAESYVRDLQWKAFTPALMSMSGWAEYDKQPWTYGEPYTSINRNYLKLRERLLPYFYTYAAEAHRTGTPIARSLVLEYPDDPKTWGGNATGEFLAGEDFLVAPVSTSGESRGGIYLPKGTWVDYWSGRLYQGPTTIESYQAPLATLPLFVKAGAVVPMWPEGINNHRDRAPGDRLTLDVYPAGNSSFTLHEDDGVTRSTASAAQEFTVSAPKDGPGNVSVRIGPSVGSYTGSPTARPYELTVHSGSAPTMVTVAGETLPALDKAAYATATTGWYYDPADRAGVVRVKTPSVAVTASATVELVGGTALGGLYPTDGLGRAEIGAPAFAPPGVTHEESVLFRNLTGQPVKDVKLSIQTPAGWTATPVGRPTSDLVQPGKVFEVRFRVTPAEGPGDKTVTGKVDYTVRGRQNSAAANATTQVPYGSLAAARNNVATSDDAATTAGNIDGAGSSFSAQSLAAAGAAPGATVTVKGTSFTWPDVPAGRPDNVTAKGQTISLSGQGTHLAVLATGTGQANGPVTVRYTDGSTETRDLGVPNWCCVDPGGFGATVALSTLGKNTPAGAHQYPTTPYRVFYQQVRIDPGKTVQAITLPDAPALHLFAATVASVPLPPAPTGDTWASDLTWVESSNGWGPVERDRSNGEDDGGDGAPLTLAGTVYPKGLGAHADSTVTYHLDRKCGRFTATVGVDDEIADYGSVVFAVKVDGVEKYRSPLMTGTSTPVPVSVDITGARLVDLVVTDGGDGKGGDHADWAAARFACG